MGWDEIGTISSAGGDFGQFGDDREKEIAIKIWVFSSIPKCYLDFLVVEAEISPQTSPSRSIGRNKRL